ncbi:hypothetical protein ACIHFD_59030 [Nonomuraea sp. NPDC051941]|uniref:hypothetical protein n=1 Tax=Nonomuraea sp. NPDC051941 TaxID=3364373 RepID=UPI0037C6EB50
MLIAMLSKGSTDAHLGLGDKSSAAPVRLMYGAPAVEVVRAEIWRWAAARQAVPRSSHSAVYRPSWRFRRALRVVLVDRRDGLAMQMPVRIECSEDAVQAAKRGAGDRRLQT